MLGQGSPNPSQLVSYKGNIGQGGPLKMEAEIGAMCL